MAVKVMPFSLEIKIFKILYTIIVTNLWSIGEEILSLVLFCACTHRKETRAIISRKENCSQKKRKE